MANTTIKRFALRAGGKIFKTIFPPEKIPFATADAKTLFPGLYQQDIQLGRLQWNWGDLPNEKGLIFLACLAKQGHSPIVEFGTLRGRTTYNLAVNSPGEVYTVDLGSDSNEGVDVDVNVEKRGYPSHKTGELYLTAPESVKSRIHQIIGDSTKLDLSHLYGKAGIVIVDGGHSYEVCKSDSEKALRLVKKGGVIIWDDYGDYWPGVKQALNELSLKVRLRHLPHENLVVHVAES